VLPASSLSLLDNAQQLRESLFADAAVTMDAPDNVSLAFATTLGHGRLDFIEFNPDFNVIISDCRWLENGEITYSGEDWVRFNFCLDANARFQFEDRGDFALTGCQLRMFYQPSGLLCAHRFTPGRSVCATISIKQTHLRRLLDTETAAPLPTEQSGDGGFFFRRLGMTPQAVRAVGDLLAMPHRGALKRLYAQAKSEELLVSAFSAAPANDLPSAPLRLRETERTRLLEVGRLLETRLANPPTVSELSRRFAMNRNKLAYGFRQLHGCSLTEFVTRHRLETAWRLLEDTDRPISEIAAGVGYAHVQSFSAAFRRHFGVAPRGARRQVMAQ
jgi:AraC-like DNA-binding protein